MMFFVSGQAKHAPTAKLAHDFLTRYGYINTGVFDNPRKEWNKEKAIVLGAGASGLAAAKHLHHLGYQYSLSSRSTIMGATPPLNIASPLPLSSLFFFVH
jgi:heterodisulfide reductase subunit A-like polyferredoxin